MKLSLLAFLTSVLFFVNSALGQDLLLVENAMESDPGISNAKYYNVDAGHFLALANHRNDILHVFPQAKLLAENCETEIFFSVQPHAGAIIAPQEIDQLPDCSNLIKIENQYIVRGKFEALFDAFSGRADVRQINFSKRSAQRLEIPRASLRNESVPDIMQAVNIDSMMATERIISGEESAVIDGQLDTMYTRYSYSNKIFTAEKYLKKRFENYGYAVELHGFSMGTIYDVKFSPVNVNIGFCSGVGKIWKTADGGQSWTISFEDAMGGVIWSVFALDDLHAYAVGENGLFVRTADGGANWSAHAIGTAAYLFGVHFFDANTGWICGDNGGIYTSTNGGLNWSPQSSGTSSRLYDVHFFDSQNGWAVGRDGKIVHTANGGANWAAQSTGTSERLYGVHSLSANEAFVVGWYGKLLKTNNGGSNWSAVSLSTSANLYDLDFVNGGAGIIVGWGGDCFTTTDGGQNWQPKANLFQSSVYGCDLIDNNNVWACGTSMFANSVNFAGGWQSQIGLLPEGALNNIIAQKTGSVHPNQYYIICGHYDSISPIPYTSAPGADDNGSGTAAVIEAARIFRNYHFEYSLRFALFPGEEQGLHGSAAYAAYAAANGDQILGVINMDMIAYDGNNDGIMEIHAGNLTGSRTLGTLLRDNVTNFTLPLSPQYLTSNSSTASDHSSFWNHGYSAVMLIEDFQDFTPYYHTPQDNIASMNLPYFHAYAKLSIATLAQLAVLNPMSIATPAGVPEGFILKSPYPNPFNPSVNVPLYLPVRQRVRMEIYNIRGQKLREIHSGLLSPGSHILSWDGKTEAGQSAASGAYFIKVIADKQTQVRKIQLLR